MDTFHDAMRVYKQQMQLGVIPKAYLGLMGYLSGLKATLKARHPEYHVSGSMYFGYMDMTYFSFFPDSLKQLKLKTGIVFIHATCQFEVWLFGVNKQVQQEYWQLFKEKGFDTYPLVASTKCEDAILTHVLTEDPNFDDLDALINLIEGGTIKFIKNVENFLIKLQ